MAYAEQTKVPVQVTQAEIEKLARRYGAKGFASAIDWKANRAQVEFALEKRRVRFSMTLPDENAMQAQRARWRALLLVIKAKLEAVERGIETFDEAFLAHIVTKDGRTYGEIHLPQLEYAHD
jgi:hypothetical protein